MSLSISEATAVNDALRFIFGQISSQDAEERALASVRLLVRSADKTLMAGLREEEVVDLFKRWSAKQARQEQTLQRLAARRRAERMGMIAHWVDGILPGSQAVIEKEGWDEFCNAVIKATRGDEEDSVLLLQRIRRDVGDGWLNSALPAGEAPAAFLTKKVEEVSRSARNW